MLSDAVVVDEAAASLVQRRHEPGVVVEGRQDQRVVFAVDLQDRLYVHLGVLRRESQCGTVYEGIIHFQMNWKATDSSN